MAYGLFNRYWHKPSINKNIWISTPHIIYRNFKLCYWINFLTLLLNKNKCRVLTQKNNILKKLYVWIEKPFDMQIWDIKNGGNKKKYGKKVCEGTRRIPTVCYYIDNWSAFISRKFSCNYYLELVICPLLLKKFYFLNK